MGVDPHADAKDAARLRLGTAAKYFRCLEFHEVGGGCWRVRIKTRNLKGRRNGSRYMTKGPVMRLT